MPCSAPQSTESTSTRSRRHGLPAPCRQPHPRAAAAHLPASLSTSGGAAWRLIIGTGDSSTPGTAPDASTGARNMALDQALLEGVADGAPAALRFYRWRPACLSLGRNQRAAAIYDAQRADALGIDVVRRPTGGLAVLHDAELTYAVIAPVTALGGPRAAYHAINRALAEGLRALGVPATLAEGARRTVAAGAFAGAHPCFRLPAAGEIVVGSQKLVGSAQRVERRTILQHGSILLDGSQAVVQQLRRQPGAGDADVEVAATTVRAVLGRVPQRVELTESFARACARVFGTALAPAGLQQNEISRALELEARFADPEWTWRR